MEIDRNIFILNLHQKRYLIRKIVIDNYTNYKYNLSDLIDVDLICQSCINDIQELFDNYIYLFYDVYDFNEKCNQINELKKTRISNDIIDHVIFKFI